MKCHKFLHTPVMFSFTVINETTKIAENKMGNEKERDVPFQQKNVQTTETEAFALSGIIFPLALQLEHMGEMTHWLSTNRNQQIIVNHL